MKICRKLLTIMTIIVLAASILAGCAGTTDNPDEPKSSEKADETEAPYDEKTDTRLFTDTLETVEGKSDVHFTFTAADTGFDVYAPIEGQWGYRYAPSIMYYPDGTMDAWFATPGTTGEWDWFTYKHSDDGGKTWSEEKIVLQPTPDSMDHYSVCDPGVIYFGGYYYIGYTSTIVSTNGGINNNVFVARSKNPDGPYEKWNGSGWGGDPQPIVYYNEADEKWGAGEPAFVVVDGKIYMYYTWACDAGEYKYVAVGDAASENWPATLDYKGRAFTSTGGDQVDVVYVEDVGKFMIVQTCNRFTTSSGIQIWESTDGIHFVKGEFNANNIAQYCHNMGISKRPDGHIQLKDTLMLGYAYASGGNDSDFWGKWATRFVYITLSTYEGDLDKTKKTKNVLITDYYWEAPENPQPTGITTLPHVVKMNEGDTYNDLKVYWLDSTVKRHEIEDTSKITFSEYDESLIEFNGTSIKALKEGKTECKVTYEGISIYIKIYVYAKGFDYEQDTPEISSIRAVESEITVYKGKANGGIHKAQIRAYVEFADGTWGEAYNDYTKDHTSYPAMVPAENYLMTFESADESIVKVSKNGQITAKSVGDTTVTVKMNGEFAFTVTVHVAEPPEELNWKDTEYK